MTYNDFPPWHNYAVRHDGRPCDCGTTKPAPPGFFERVEVEAERQRIGPAMLVLVLVGWLLGVVSVLAALVVIE